jgi:hypothetical protein
MSEHQTAVEHHLETLGIFLQVFGDERGDREGSLARIAEVVGSNNLARVLERFAAAYAECFGRPPEDWPPEWLARHKAAAEAAAERSGR